MTRVHYLATAAVFALAVAGQARAATFFVDPSADKDGTKLFLTKAKDATSSTGSVAAPNDVNIMVTSAADFANGYANIKPVKGGSLTDLVFTPVNPNEFDSFSFRGESILGATTVAVVISDNQGDPAQMIDFSIANANQDFGRDGIISTNGGTIRSVELVLSGGFEEVKQIDFDCVNASAACAANIVPEPATWALMLLGVGGLGGVMRFRRREPATAK